MKINPQLQLLATGLAIGIAVLTFSAGPAEATAGLPNDHIELKPKPKGTGGKMCTITNPDGEIEFFFPGDQLWDPLTGKAKTCQSNGKWLLEVEVPPVVAPTPAGGGVLAPTP